MQEASSLNVIWRMSITCVTIPARSGSQEWLLACRNSLSIQPGASHFTPLGCILAEDARHGHYEPKEQGSSECLVTSVADRCRCGRLVLHLGPGSRWQCSRTRLPQKWTRSLSGRLLHGLLSWHARVNGSWHLLASMPVSGSSRALTPPSR